MEDVLVGAGDLLFIDSSHVLRAGGDLPYLFGEVVPSLPVGVLVHVHDIYLPFAYPSRFAKAMWTEQYVLQAMLAHTPRYQVVFASHMMGRDHTEAMRQAFGPYVGSNPKAYGQSFWFVTT